jgi:predicted RNase H-like HicB family nuclease
MTMRYAVIYEATSTGFSAYVPDLPGVAVAGDSREQTRDLLRKAVAWHLEAMAADGLPIPTPTTGGGTGTRTGGSLARWRGAAEPGGSRNPGLALWVIECE